MLNKSGIGKRKPCEVYFIIFVNINGNISFFERERLVQPGVHEPFSAAQLGTHCVLKGLGQAIKGPELFFPCDLKTEDKKALRS